MRHGRRIHHSTSFSINSHSHLSLVSPRELLTFGQVRGARLGREQVKRKSTAREFNSIYRQFSLLDVPVHRFFPTVASEHDG